MRRRDYIKIALTDPFCLYMIALCGLVVVATVLFFAGATNTAWIVSYAGTVLVIVATFAYVGLRDPEGRFPDAGFWDRIGKVLSFKRR